MTKLIPLTQGKFAIVDDADFEWLSQFKWHLAGRYAKGYVNGRVVSMHRLLMDTPTGLVTDHRNHRCLDNRRSNLRNITQAENTRNASKYFEARNDPRAQKALWHLQFEQNRAYYDAVMAHIETEATVKALCDDGVPDWWQIAEQLDYDCRRFAV